MEQEVTYVTRESRSATWADGTSTLNEAGMTEGVCVRVLENGGQGIVTARSADKSRIPELVSRAHEMSKVSPRDPHRKLAVPAAKYPEPFETDKSLFTRSIDDILLELKGAEQKILKSDKRVKKVIKLQYSEGRATSTLSNSNGIDLSDSSSSATLVVEVLAEEAGMSEVAWDFQSERKAAGLSLEKIAVSTALHAAESLGGKPMASGKYAVVLHPRVATQILGLLSNALSAESVQLERSFFRGKLNQAVASSKVTLIDDPLLPQGVASAPFDDEGTPHQTCVMVKDGVLSDYFYDLRSASKDGRASNGHGVKESLSLAPRPGSTNFYMKPGSENLQAMLASHAQVFHLFDVMGLHMADPITGEFSLGAAGFLYENGKRVRPVRGVTIAGSLASLLKEVSAVGSDLTWYGSTGAPSVLLSQVMIAGT